jgi:hypothetical protein
MIAGMDEPNNKSLIWPFVAAATMLLLIATLAAILALTWRS